MKFSLEQNEIVEFSALSSNGEDKAVPEPMGVNSLILIPVFVEKQWWGMLALDDCTSRRKWTDAEKGSLKTWADMLGATIARQRAEAALLDAKKNLEKRVSERTSELRDQVAVKEQALSDLASAQNSLVELSRAAGMAEVATGVLHNVGNVLNSVNVSCTLLTEEIRGSRAGNVAKIAEMLENAPGGLIAFLTRDERGRQIPAYLSSLGDALVKEHRVMHNETKLLSDRIEHIKEIVTMQQNYGRVSGVSEHVSPSLLMEDALLLNSGGLTRHDIGVVKEYDTVEPIRTEKHKVLQILVNLINNAKYACSESSQDDKAIALKIYNGKQNQVCLEVSDNGIGIPPDNLSRIFQHGFTTRKTGHGFGLHSGALVAKEMGGSLQALSDGVGCGSTFTLSIPREVKGDGNMISPEKKVEYRIIVIDDNPAIHEDFRKILTPSSESDAALEDMESLLFGEESRKDTENRFELVSAYQGQEGLEKVVRAQEEGRPFFPCLCRRTNASRVGRCGNHKPFMAGVS